MNPDNQPLSFEEITNLISKMRYGQNIGDFLVCANRVFTNERNSEPVSDIYNEVSIGNHSPSDRLRETLTRMCGMYNWSRSGCATALTKANMCPAARLLSQSSTNIQSSSNAATFTSGRPIDAISSAIKEGQIALTSENTKVSHLLTDPRLEEWYSVICFYINQSEVWIYMLNDANIVGQDVDSQITDWRIKYSEGNFNPAKEVFKRLVSKDPEILKYKLNGYLTELIENHPFFNEPVKQLLKWIQSNDEKVSKRKTDTHVKQRELREWLVSVFNAANIFDKDIDKLVAGLTNQGVRSIEDLYTFDSGDFIVCGFNLLQAKTAANSLKAQKK
jgi:hypothetical protein